MPTETNLSQPPRIAAADLITILLTIVGVGIAVIAILVGEIHDIRQQSAVGQAAIQQQAETAQAEIRQLIQSSESGRQADARAINARVDAAEQLMVASSPLPYRCPPLG